MQLLSGFFLLLVRLPETHCPKISGIRSVLQTVTDNHWRHFYFRITSVFSALEVLYENALYTFTFDIDIFDIDIERIFFVISKAAAVATCLTINCLIGKWVFRHIYASILYADDIVLLSCSCYGMQQLINICVEYGVTWDISFSANKTQCIAFGGRNPQISLRMGSVVHWLVYCSGLHV